MAALVAAQVVACEGEPFQQSVAPSDPRIGTNPPGQVSIIDVAANGTMGTTKNLDFTVSVQLCKPVP